MNVSRFVMAAVLVAGCSGEPGVERDAPAATGEPAPAAAAREEAPSAEPVATTGKARDTASPARAEAAREARRAAVATAASRERAEEAALAEDARQAARGPVTRAAAQAGVNSRAAVLQDFKARVDQYLAIRKQAAKGDAKLEPTEDPAEITAAENTLAARIRALRAGATQGDVFTVEIRQAFRELLAPELTGEDGRDAKAILKDDAPDPAAIPFKVNAKYPEGQPRPTVPATLLLNLPTLPDPLEYRIIGRHLILLDTEADLIVDYMPNAIR